MSQARPKPWETGVAGASISTSQTTNNTSVNNTQTPLSTASSSSNGPAVPPKPSSIPVSSTTPQTTTSTSTNINSLGTTLPSQASSSMYGNGYGNGYGNSYGNSYGSYGNSYGGLDGYGNTYGGLGGYGSSYGGYGSYGGLSGLSGLGGFSGMGRYSRMGGYGGMNGMMGGMGGMGTMGTDENGGTLNGVADATARTFQVLENVVYAVSAVAALLESTYYATHNSFFTILGVADQIGNIGSIGGAVKDSFVGSVSNSAKMLTNGTSGSNSSSSNNGPLGLYAVLAWLKRILKKLLGFSTEHDTSSFSGSHGLLQEFSNWKNGISISGLNSKKTKQKKMSLKPLLVFLVALLGLPMLMSKFVRYIEREQQRKIERIDGHGNGSGINGNTNINNSIITNDVISASQSNKFDPRSLEFARALYDYIPEREEEQASGWKEIKLTRGDLVAILNSMDGWSHCRARDGRVGYVPTNYLEIVKRANKSITIDNTSQEKDGEHLKKSVSKAI